MNPPVPAEFARRMIEMYGEAGARWLDDLPRLLAACAERWSLVIGSPFAPLSYNYVAPAVRQKDETNVVLKIGFPSVELQTEAQALRLYDGRGIARLLETDAQNGALLLERLSPGETLIALAARDDEAATEIAARVMGALWRPAPPAPHVFPTLADWFAGLTRLRARFEGGTGPLPAPLVERAEGLCADLLGFPEPFVLLHGDLHHFNILTAAREPYLAIDPKGLVGEPAYEIGAFLHNALPERGNEPCLARLLSRRIHIFASVLGLDAARIRGWAVAQAVLSACWTVEDHGHGWESAIAAAERLAALPED